MIIEERTGELVLCPAMAVPLRDFDAEKMASWIKRDEEEMEAFLANEKKDRGTPVFMDTSVLLAASGSVKGASRYVT